MIQHFDNLQTPLKSIKKYPRLSDQERRFKDAGWGSANARNLWDLWSDSSFLCVAQRLALNNIEPFDEWEEFALFASHYFLLEASSDARFQGQAPDDQLSTIDQTQEEFPMTTLQPAGSIKSVIHRRFGAMFEIAPGTLGNHGGHGTNSRLNVTTAYRLGSELGHQEPCPSLEIEPRMCHTITELEATNALLVGGRASPDRAMSDCWLRQGQTWKRIEDVPSPLYRHCSIAIGNQQKKDAVLIFGGRLNGRHTSDAWLLWHESTGWVQMVVQGIRPGPRFGAALSAMDVNRGYMVSGSKLILFLSSIVFEVTRFAVRLRAICQ